MLNETANRSQHLSEVNACMFLNQNLSIYLTVAIQKEMMKTRLANCRRILPWILNMLSFVLIFHLLFANYYYLWINDVNYIVHCRVRARPGYNNSGHEDWLWWILSLSKHRHNTAPAKSVNFNDEHQRNRLSFPNFKSPNLPVYQTTQFLCFAENFNKQQFTSLVQKLAILTFFFVILYSLRKWLFSPSTLTLNLCQYLHRTENHDNGVFSKWNGNSLNSVNLINHWSMN